MTIDLRSDVLGPLSPEVLSAFRSAANRQPGFGRHDDVEESALCAEAAALFNFEDALFLPTGTMANQIAVRLWVQAGEGILADRLSHLATNEVASVAGLNGAVMRLLDCENGHPKSDQVAVTCAGSITSASERSLRLVWLENTHNRTGGTVMPALRLQTIAEVSRANNLTVHVDGARIWDALAATRAEPISIFTGASSAMVALNKIAGAPVGALLLGKRDFIDEAARVQKMFGGLWRPMTAPAAAARVALKQWSERAVIAHEAAAVFAKRLKALVGEMLPVPLPQTNIVMLQLPDEAAVMRLMKRIDPNELRVSPYQNGKIRCVFHAGIDRHQALAAASMLTPALNESVSL